MVSEFGSALNERTELDCFTSITDYFTSSGLANDGRHAPIQSWFYWCATNMQYSCKSRAVPLLMGCSTNLRAMSRPFRDRNPLPRPGLMVSISQHFYGGMHFALSKKLIM